MLELRDAPAAREWLCAGVCAARLARPSPDLLAEAAPWLAGVLGEFGALPPAGVVVDVGRTLLAGVALPSRGLDMGDSGLRAAVRAWETEVVGRLQSERRLPACAEAIARLPASMRSEAVSVYLARLLGRLEVEGASIAPGVARRLETMTADEVVETGLTAIGGSASIVGTLADAYTQLVRASRHASQLITEADVFVLEHLPLLRTQAQRLEVAQIADVSARLSRALPKRLRRRSPSGHVAASLEDESHYPSGGFASIATSGSLENLVTSELVYMEDTGEVDLFEVRYVEGELLYYSRDETVLVREQRTFFFVLQPELVRARFKDRELEWQRLVIVLGLLLCLVQRLSEWLNEAGLQFRVVFLHDAQTRMTPLDAERSLCELLLSEWIQKGVARVTDCESWSDLLAETVTAERSGQVDVLSIRFAGAPSAPGKQSRMTWLDVGETRPVVGGERLPVAGDGDEPVWQDWLRAAATIAQTLC